jgi:hypothetical protein
MSESKQLTRSLRLEQLQYKYDRAVVKVTECARRYEKAVYARAAAHEEIMKLRGTA